MRLIVLIATLGLLAGCGEEERPTASPTATATGGDRLVVELRPEGEGGRVKRREVTDIPAGVTPEDFEPFSTAVACAAVFGGPQTARVTGTLGGKRIDAAFARNNGCEIARWDALEAVLGRVAGTPPPPPP